MDHCDYDAPEFHSVRLMTARKVHRCGECGCDIRAGERYEHVFGKWGGLVSQHKTCGRCAQFRTWYAANRPCLCWCYSNVHDDIREDVRNDGHIMLEEAPGFLFQVGRRYAAICRRAMADGRLRLRIGKRQRRKWQVLPPAE